MKKLLLVACLITGMNIMAETISKDQMIQQIYQVEQAFNVMLAEKGQAEAFAFFAADEASLVRGENVITGKLNIKTYYEASTMTDIRLSWKPDFVDLSDDFSMAYSYGKYQYSGINKDGKAISATGIFHTVWKRQADGSWKYVYD